MRIEATHYIENHNGFLSESIMPINMIYECLYWNKLMGFDTIAIFKIQQVHTPGEDSNTLDYRMKRRALNMKK